MSEIVTNAKCGSGSVQRELERLNETGLILNHKVGSLRFFKGNTECPIYPELQKIFIKISSQIDIAFIFGSTAKGADHAASDIDLVVVSDELKLEPSSTEEIEGLVQAFD